MSTDDPTPDPAPDADLTPDADPAPDTEATPDPTPDPAPEPDPAPTPDPKPTPPAQPGRRSRQRAAEAAAREARQADSAKKFRRYGIPGLAALVVLVLVIGAVVLLRNDDSAPATAPVSGRSQATLMIQVVPQVGRAAVGSALTAADGSAGNGVFLALSGRLITDIPGRGTTTLDQASASTSTTAAGQAISDQLDVLVDGSWLLTGPALAALIDKVGGITVDVDVPVTSGSISIPAGTSKTLTGAQAVAYATYVGPGETDAAHLARFTAVWTALLGKLPNDVTATRNLVAGSAGSVTTLTPDQLATYLVDLHRAVASDSVAYPTLPTVLVDNVVGKPSYRLDAAKVPALLKAQFAGSLPPTRPGGPVSVLVQNGVGTPGLSEKARTKLKAAGLTFQAGGNADRFNYATSVILIPDSSVAAQAKGAEVAKALGLPTSAIKQSEQPQSVADVLVILGADFRG